MDKKKLYRCRVELSINSSEREISRRFGPGQIVDLEEIIGTDKEGNQVKIADEVPADCFEEISEPDPAPAPVEEPKKKRTTRARGNK